MEIDGELQVVGAGEGLLAVWHDVVPAFEAEVRDWYNRQHHAERLAVPGFLSAHRYERVSGQGAAIMSLYRTASPQVLASPAYLERLRQPTEWTRAVMPNYRNTCRSACRLAWQIGDAEGGAVAVLAVAGDSRPAGELGDRALAAARSLKPAPGVLRVRWIVPDAAAGASTATPERNLRGAADAGVDWALLVDANLEEQAAGALQALGAMADLLPSEDAAIRQRGCYRLVYAGRAR